MYDGQWQKGSGERECGGMAKVMVPDSVVNTTPQMEWRLTCRRAVDTSTCYCDLLAPALGAVGSYLGEIAQLHSSATEAEVNAGLQDSRICDIRIAIPVYSHARPMDPSAAKYCPNIRAPLIVDSDGRSPSVKRCLRLMSSRAFWVTEEVAISAAE